MALWLCLDSEKTVDVLIDDAAVWTGVSRNLVEAPALDALQRLVDLGVVVAQ